ncbi:hypothetical protein B0H17DRAFT_1087515, partial [Mycena rosella]
MRASFFFLFTSFPLCIPGLSFVLDFSIFRRVCVVPRCASAYSPYSQLRLHRVRRQPTSGGEL